MVRTGALAVGMVAAAACGMPDAGRYGRLVADIAPVRVNATDDVHRPGFNGRVWVSRPIIGGLAGHWAAHSNPAAEYYGAYDVPATYVPVRVGHTRIAIDAWQRLDAPGLVRLEVARQQWLYEHNYTGGVRTFVNDAVLWRSAVPGDSGARGGGDAVAEHRRIVPRATIRVRDHVPRVRRPLRVEATDAPSLPRVLSVSLQPDSRIIVRARECSVIATAAAGATPPGD